MAVAPGGKQPLWPRPVQLAVGLALTALLFYVLGRWQHDEPAAVPEDTARPMLDLNRASRAELRLLPGLGETLVERLLIHRQEQGPFQRVDDLKQVPGFGPKTLERLRPWLFVGDLPAVATAPEIKPLTGKGRISAYVEPMAAPVVVKAGKKEAGIKDRIDINAADAAALQKLPGIGPKLSQRIADERQLRGPFRTVEELRRVSGIGAKTLERLRPYVTVAEIKP